MDDLQYLAQHDVMTLQLYKYVLNLVINGWPSIPFKRHLDGFNANVLNLVINGWPSIPLYSSLFHFFWIQVLNLVINGWPSIPLTKGMNVVFMLERSLFYMVAKFEHFSVIHGFLTFYIKFLLQFFCFFLK